MRATELALGIALLGAMLVTLPKPAKGQDEPDLEVQASDISFTPDSSVVVGTNVRIDADIHNVGNCYIALGDGEPLEPYDEVDYLYSISGSVTRTIRIRARIRSQTGNLAIGEARVGNYPGAITTSSTAWETKDSTYFSVPTDEDTMYLALREGGDNTDLEVDWLEALECDLLGQNCSTLPGSHNEAEDYDSGGDTVNHIHPQQVAVDIYDGDPNSGGIQINGTQTVGDVQRTTESGTVWILRAGAVATATVTWKAEPVGWHDIYADIQPHPREQQAANNTAFKPIWVTGGYPITGNVRLQIGDAQGPDTGLAIPIGFTTVPGGRIYANPSAAIIQESMGPDPRKIIIPNRVFHHPGTPPVLLPLYGANNNYWQVLTAINVTIPTTPMRPGDVLLNVLQKGGRTGPPNATWCPGQPIPNATYNPSCTAAAAAPLASVPGILRYRKTENQFGGPLSGQFGGVVDLALRLGGSPPPCNFATTPCEAFFAIGPPLQTLAIGEPFGRWTKTTAPPPFPGHFNIIAAAGGTIVYITPTGLGPGRSNAASSWGGPWTTGQIQNTVLTLGPVGSEMFTWTGADMRVNGTGTLSLIAGAVSNRGTSGPNANRGWLNITVPEPAAVVSAASGLLLVLGCHRLVRRRSR